MGGRRCACGFGFVLAAVWMICGAPTCAAASATVATSLHRAEYVRLIEPFNELLHKDPKAAVVKAGELARKARQLMPNDQRRADALELLARAYLGVERYGEALPLAAEVVRIRRLADPVDQELLAQLSPQMSDI